MKKMFALLLVLAMLVPMGLVASADNEVKVQPFYSLGWSDFDQETYPYLDGLVTSNFKNIGDRAVLTYGGGSMTHGSYDEEDVLAVAKALKKTMDSRPEGTRYWHLFGPSKILKLAPKNVINLEHGIVQLKEMFTDVINKYKEIGGQLDGVVIDTEYVGLSSYYIKANTDSQTNNAIKNPMVYYQIVNDPVYQERIRPELEARGFKFYPGDNPLTPEIYGISGSAGSAYSNCASIWDTVIRNHLNNYVNEWCYESLKAAFPEASLSDYQSLDSYTWLKMAAVTDSGETMTGGNSNRVGTASCYSFYYARPSKDFFKNNNKYAGYNDALYAATPFNIMLYDINFARHMYLSNPNRQIAPWITSYYYNKSREGTIALTPYYSELLYHLGLMDPEPFLSYTYVNEYSAENYKNTQIIMNANMAELTRVAGFSDRKPIEMTQNWNSKYILSGMYANGRNIWRITPNTDVISLEDFKVSGTTDPTFYVNGETVTFPGGKIVEDTEIPIAGTCGYWVETAANVTPIVTADADRYEKYPALKIDFEDAKEGSFDYNTSKPTGAWEFTWKQGGKSTIVTVDGNKKLAISGNSANRLVDLPNNVTAGDTYADNQIWTVTVTIPEGLAAEAELVLLKYTGNKQKIDDGGFKIQGGKLYYGARGEYKELMDITAGTYTFQRAMNFTEVNKFFCDYIVYDAEGKVVKTVEDVQVPTFQYITNIEIACTAADKQILIDDYKLMVAGIAADFGLYDFETGMFSNTTEARAASTAYRLSWLNASDKEETAVVMADIYEGSTLKEQKTVKTIKMLPGTDGIDTGVVEIAEGQSVKVYVKADFRVAVEGQEEAFVPETPLNTNPGATDPTTPGGSEGGNNQGGNNEGGNNEGGNNAGGEDSGNSMTIIILVAVVVVAVGGIVVALMLTKKKKPAKTEEKPEEKTEE